MAKVPIETTPKPSTKKHLARQEKENRQKKVLLWSIIGILVVIVGLILYGVLDKNVFTPMKAVVRVNKQTITVDQFQKRVQYERLSMVENYLTYATSPYATIFQSSLMQLQDQLDNYLQFGSDVLDKMINEEVLALKASELGITISEEDIDRELERGFGFYPKGTPTPAPTATEVVYRPTSTFSPAQLALVTLTPTATLEPTQTPAAATPTAELTQTSTPEVTATATSIPTATAIPPTATPYTEAGFKGLYETMITNINAQFPYTEKDFREYVRALLLNQKAFEVLTKDVTVDQDMVWARHILVATEEEAKSVLALIEKGEDWTSLAAQFSTDTSNSVKGGDLGWFTKGQMVETFEQAAYELGIGEISQPVQTTFGYHIIQVLGHEVRQLSAEELDAMKNRVFSKYIEDAKAEMEIKKLDLWASVAPATPAIPDDYRISYTQ